MTDRHYTRLDCLFCCALGLGCTCVLYASAIVFQTFFLLKDQAQ